MNKLKQRETQTALIAPIVMLLAPKLGVPEDVLGEFFTALGLVGAALIGGRSYAKGRAGK